MEGKRESRSEAINCIISAYKLNPPRINAAAAVNVVEGKAGSEWKTGELRDSNKEMDEVKAVERKQGSYDCGANTVGL